MNPASSLKDFLENIKCNYIKRRKEISNMFTIINIKLDSMPEFRRSLRNCACMLMRNGADKAHRIDILCACTKRILEQTTEVDFSKKLQLIIVNLENLMYLSMSELRQLRSDIRHHKNRGMVSNQIFEDKNPKVHTNLKILNSSENEDLNPHKEVMRLKKEIDMKKAEMMKIKEDLLEYESIPPDLQLARKMLEDVKSYANMLKNEIELLSRNSFLDTSSSSFSP